jgi:hypothetical protein
MNLFLWGMSITIKSGALIPVLFMVPNVLWMLLPKTNVGEQVSVPMILTIAENIGRVAVFLLPFFFSLDLNKEFSALVGIGMGLALTVYYVSWVRYFAGGRLAEHFRAPLLGLPLPMAVAPTVFLVLSSYLMSSWLMLGAAILFGVAHIWISALSL